MLTRLLFTLALISFLLVASNNHAFSENVKQELLSSRYTDAASRKPSPWIAFGLTASFYGGSYFLLRSGLNNGGSESTVLIGAVGMMLSPSIGHFYSGDKTRGSIVLLASTAGVTLASLSALVGMFGCIEGCDETTSKWVTGGAIAGLAMHAGSALFGLIDGTLAAKRAQKRFTWTPSLIMMSKGNRPSLGIGVLGQF